MPPKAPVKGLAKAVEHEAGNLAAQEAAKQAINKGAKYGAGAALGASNFVQEAGSIYPEALDQAEKDGRTLNGGDLARIAGAGAAAAGVDTLTDMSMLKGVLHGGSNSANILKRAAKTIPMGMAKEGATEGIQTGIERWGAQQDLGNNEAVTDYIDSAALGALGGGLAGAGGALRRSGNGTTVENQEIPQTSNQESTQQITSNTQSPFTGQSNNTSPIIDESKLYDLTGIPPAPVIDKGKLPPDTLSYENGVDYTQPQTNLSQTDLNEFQKNINNGIDYSQTPAHENWSLDTTTPQIYDNSIDFDSKRTKDLQSQVEFNDLYGHSTPDPLIDYSTLSPFSDVQQPLINQKKLSEQMGIDPNNGPMSSAAALAVDSGASSVLQTGFAQEQQTQGQTVAPLSDAVPSDYRQLMEQNNGQSFGTGFENAALQQGNTQADNASKSSPQSDNASKSLPQQNDTHTAKAMAGQTETNGAATAQAKTAQPILGIDGQNKWFGSQEKAQAFIDKKNLGNDYQVDRDGKRFEIQPKKLQSTSQNVDTLPKTESSNQDDVPNPYNENKLRAQVRDLNLQASKEAQANNAKDSNYIANLGNTASARSNEKVKQQLPDLYKRAEELAKTAEITSAGRRGNTHFSSLSFKGDSSFVSGDAWPKRPTKDEILQQAIWHLSQDDKNGTPKNVQSALQITELEKQFKNEKSVAKKAQIRKQITELQNGLTEQAQSSVSLNQPQKTTVENLSGEFKKIEESTTRINAVRQRMREANPEIFTAENDRVRETHGLTNARVASIADEIKTSGNYELSDREYEKIKNNPNYKIDYDARNFTGKVTAVKDPHSGEWVGNNEQTATDSKKVSSDQQKDIEQFITENKSAFPNNWQRDSQWSAQARAAVEKKLDEILPGDINQKEFQTQVDQAMEFAKKQYPTLEQQHEQRESKIQSWINEWNQLKENGTASELDNFHKKVKVALNGIAQKKGVVAEFEQLKVDIENFAKDYNKLPKTEQSTNTNPSAAETATTNNQQVNEATNTEATPKPKAEASENRLVSDDRAAELRARLKAKLSQLNSGIDPEIMAIGAELAVYHIERGARKFAALAKNTAVYTAVPSMRNCIFEPEWTFVSVISMPITIRSELS